jgi:tetratricopeptide (TPR) repeat protein
VQGCALGIAMVYDDLPVRTISSIYLETGLMQGFGKPVILFVDKRKNLSSDYIRHYAIFFKSKDYLPKYRSLLGDIGKLPEDVYEEVARLALKAGDYEKAAKYYQEAYLIGPKHKILITLQSMASTLDKSTDIPRAYKQRLFENIEHFCSRVK